MNKIPEEKQIVEIYDMHKFGKSCRLSAPMQPLYLTFYW